MESDTLHQRAIWIASFPKSGNTWIRVFLHNLTHQLHGDESHCQDINFLHELTEREPVIGRFERALGKPAAEATPAQIAAARCAVQADLVRGQDGPVFIKTHNAVAMVEGAPTINFDITRAAVYVLRNPLDIAVSYAHFSGTGLDAAIAQMNDGGAYLGSGERRVYEFLGSWSFHVASWLSIPHRPVLILRYEDMLSDPARSFGRLAAFLRLRPSPERLRRAIEMSSFEELAAQERRAGFVERPETAERFFRAGQAGQWREALSADQVKSIIAAHAPMMMRFGYLEAVC
jgi:Sulfotransferase domain